MVAAVEDIAVVWELPWAVMVVGLVRTPRWCPMTTMLRITGLSHGAFTTCTQNIPRSRANTCPFASDGFWFGWEISLKRWELFVLLLIFFLALHASSGGSVRIMFVSACYGTDRINICLCPFVFTRPSEFSSLSVSVSVSEPRRH